MIWKIILGIVIIYFIYASINNKTKDNTNNESQISQVNETNREEEKNRKREEYQKAETERVNKLIADTKTAGLQPINTDLVLQKGEVCYIAERARSRYGTRSKECMFYLTSQRVVVLATADIGINAPLSDVMRYGTAEVSTRFDKIGDSNYSRYFGDMSSNSHMTIDEELEQERSFIRKVLNLQVAHRNYVLECSSDVDKLATIIGMVLEQYHNEQ